MGLSNVFRSKIFFLELLVGNFFFRVYQQLFVFLVLDMDLSGTRAHGCFENALILRFQHPEHANQAIQLCNTLFLCFLDGKHNFYHEIMAMSYGEKG